MDPNKEEGSSKIGTSKFRSKGRRKRKQERSTKKLNSGMQECFADILAKLLQNSKLIQANLAHLGGGMWGVKCTTAIEKAQTQFVERGKEEEEALDRSTAILIKEFAWERLHCGYWQDVDVNWREMYTIGCVLESFYESDVTNAIKCLDSSLLLGGPALAEEIHSLIDHLSNTPEDLKKPRGREGICLEEENRKPKARKTQPSSEWIEIPNFAVFNDLCSNASLLVPYESVPSMDKFLNHHMRGKAPLIIGGAMEHWPATKDGERSWKNLYYLRKVCGVRTVPIEIGNHYLSDGWSQKLMTFNEFLDNHLLDTSQENPTGYLAQTQLFDQIEPLRKDIAIPDYCSLSEEIGQEEELRINAWFGPKGTVTPCHHDPTHNLLCQVVGAKYIRLFSPSESPYLYPYEGKMCNNSQVDIENPDHEKFPLFKNAKYLECILKEGEMLYIPPKWWHFVKSLTISFSVSFWWM